MGKSILSVNGMIAGFAGAAGLGLVVKQSMDAVAEIDRLSTMAGVGAEAFQELSYAAGQYQITQDALTDGLKELALRGDEFVVDGAGPGKDAFERLGYSAKELNGMLDDTPGLLRDIISRMEGLDKASQIRLADELFGGTGGEQFVSMIQGGAKALDGMRQSANDLGMVIENSMIKQNVEAKKKVEQLTTVVSTQFNSIMVELSPAIIQVADVTTDWVKANRDLIKQDVSGTISGIGDAIENISPVLKGFAGTVHNITESFKGWGLVSGGALSLSEFATMDPGELQAYIADFDSGIITLKDKLHGVQDEIVDFQDKIKAAEGTDEFIWSNEQLAGFRDKVSQLKTKEKEILESIQNIRAAENKIVSSTPGANHRNSYYSKMFSDVNKQTPKRTFGSTGTGGVSDEAEKAAAAITSAYSSAYATLDIMTQETFDAMMSKYRQDYNEFINITGDKETAQAVYAENVAALSEKMYGKISDSRQEIAKGLEASNEDYLKDMADSANEPKNTWESAFSGWATSYTSTLNDMLWGSETTFEGIATSFGKMLTQMALQKSVSGLFDADWGEIGSSIAGLFTASSAGNIFPVNPNGISAYSNKIVSSPTVFPFAAGIGLMGEAGAEAILPLTRASTGNLGVEANVGGGYSNLTVNNYISVESSGDSDSDQDLARNIATQIDVAVRRIIADEKRHGGILA
nr:phage tail tape measure C-terminal domain-containing protein [uncultured Desulfobacter sp.]